jgi:hypothetical protein
MTIKYWKFWKKFQVIVNLYLQIIESESDYELEEEVQGENLSKLHENVPVIQVEDEDTTVVDGSCCRR